jgi:hypothetical protein
MPIDLEKMAHERLSVSDSEAISALLMPMYLHDVDVDDAGCFVSVMSLKADTPKAIATLADYAQALYEIAATADAVSKYVGVPMPGFASIAKIAKKMEKHTKSAVVTAQAISIAKGGI